MLLTKLVFAFHLVFVPLMVHSSGVDRAKQELDCLKANIFFEARGESLRGKEAVAKVTINRVKSKHYPDSICTVVFQKSQFDWVRQQPWSKIQKVMQGDLRGYNSLDRRAYYESKKTAEKALKMRLNVLPDDALWYHRVDVNPRWAKTLQKAQVVGKHIFYAPKDHKK